MQLFAAMTAVFLTSGSVQSLAEACAHMGDVFEGSDSEEEEEGRRGSGTNQAVVASPVVINSFPCRQEDFFLSFGQILYIKVCCSRALTRHSLPLVFSFISRCVKDSRSRDRVVFFLRRFLGGGKYAAEGSPLQSAVPLNLKWNLFV